MSYSNQNRFSNVHTEGMGYVSNWKDHGDFTTVTFCLLEGAENNIDQLYVSLTLSCPKAKELLQRYVTEIDNRDVKVFAGFRFAKFRAKPFMYRDDSPKAGQLGVNYSARLIKVMYLKVGDLIVNLPKDQSEAVTDYGVNVSQAAVPVTSTLVAQGSQEANNNPYFTVPLVVKLSKNEPNFNVTKARLKEDGYQWHSEMGVWTKPEVILNPNDPHLVAKRQELVKLGYKNDSDRDGLTWRMTFGQPKSSANNNVRHHGHVVSQTQGQPTSALFDKPFRVSLDKSEPNFDAIKDQLKQGGYTWDAENKHWALVNVVLDVNDPQLNSRVAVLVNNGYTNPTQDGVSWERSDLLQRRSSNNRGQKRSYKNGYQNQGYQQNNRGPVTNQYHA